MIYQNELKTENKKTKNSFISVYFAVFQKRVWAKNPNRVTKINESQAVIYCSQLRSVQSRHRNVVLPLSGEGTKVSEDPLQEFQSRQTQQQIITVATVNDPKAMDKTKFIGVPVQTIPIKSEPEYVEEVEWMPNEASGNENDVKGDFYGDIKYKVSDVGETDDSKAAASGFTESFTEDVAWASKDLGLFETVNYLVYCKDFLPCIFLLFSVLGKK